MRPRPRFMRPACCWPCWLEFSMQVGAAIAAWKFEQEGGIFGLAAALDRELGGEEA